jgi:GT2 family glycosyltransferase
MTGPPPKDHAAPSVLVVLVVSEAGEWLRECLSCLASQTYPRLAVMAVDEDKTNGSHEILASAIGEGRVLSVPRTGGFAGAMSAALTLPVAAGVDYVCFVHSDVELDPDAIARLVDAASLDDGGVVGAKIVDHDNPRMLLDVGRSADRFGHSYTPLQPGEIDQGQFDRVIDVLCVSSAAMLLSRAVWQRIGTFDERLHGENAELDFCWRARLAGFRVLMTPLARVRHRTASIEESAGALDRFEQDRSALAAMLKNYGLLSLLWLLPLSGVLALVRIVYLTLSRRFEEAYDVLAAGTWNVSHLRGTLARRRQVQRARRVKDRALRRFMESAGLRLPRWFQTAERILEEQMEIEAEEAGEPATRRLRDRTASLVGAHPVVVAAFLGSCVAAVVGRGLLRTGPLFGGVLPAFPGGAGFLSELASGFRTTGLGGTLAASPALGALGGLSAVLAGRADEVQRVALAGSTGLASVLMYRASVRLTKLPGASVVAAIAYSVSAVVLWAFSQGRIDLLFALAVLPALSERLEVAFGRVGPAGGRWRFVAGAAVTIAVGIAFLPGIALALGSLILIQAVAGRARVRGLLLSLVSICGAAALLFPFVPTILSGHGASLGSRIGSPDVAALARLALGDAPGAWVIAYFLPAAAFLSFALVGAEHRTKAFRSMMAVVAGLVLAWLSAAGYLPASLSNAPVYIAMAAGAEAMLVGFGLASVLTGLGRESFGLRQIFTALMAVVLGAGICIQVVAAMFGGWSVGGPSKIPAAWTVASGDETGDFRVLWVGSPDGLPFPSPGGDPMAVATAGPASLDYGLTGRAGTSALDIGRALTGPGADALHEAMSEIVTGTTVHGGALLAPFGVRFVIADPTRLTPSALRMLQSQVDLNREPESGLLIFRDSAAIPPAAVLAADDATMKTMASAAPSDISMFTAPGATPLAAVKGGWHGQASAGVAFVSTEFDGDWRLQGTSVKPQRAFGWATSFSGSGTMTGATVDIRFGHQALRTLEAWLLAALWAAALWVTRKPVAR